MKPSFSSIKTRFEHFAEKQGLLIITTVCVAVICTTALYTRKSQTAYVSPTPPSDHISAANLLQQSLSKAATPAPSPSASPVMWTAPVANGVVIRPFHLQNMICYDTGVWRIHGAADIQSAGSAEVCAISNGEVIDCGSDALNGVWITIEHPEGVTACYAGLASANDYIPGDSVRKGDVIGFLGNSKADETTLGPHLHLQTTKDGKPVNPLSLWAAADQ